jgi:hypothetical protein
VLQQAGHEVRFFNGAFLSHEESSQVKQFDPAFIGIYSTTFGWKKAKKTAEDFRNISGRRSLFVQGSLSCRCAGGMSC